MLACIFAGYVQLVAAKNWTGSGRRCRTKTSNLMMKLKRLTEERKKNLAALYRRIGAFNCIPITTARH